MVTKRGFSLLELLVTISIMAILIAIGIASYSTVNKQSRDSKRKSDIEQLRSAIEMYRADNGFYPSSGSGNWVDASDVMNGLTVALVPSYIAVIPSDPKLTQTYQYKATNVSGGNYYGYCISTQLESEDPADTCTDTLPAGHNYGLKNP